MMTIPLSKGLHAIVDDQDYEAVMKFSWCAAKSKYVFYAKAWTRGSHKDRKKISMHRVILGIKDSNVLVDHINHNGLDNRRENLRLATRQQNNLNQIIKPNKSSQFRGVYFDKQRKKWRAKVAINGVKHIRFFDSELEAAQYRDSKAKELHGDFASLNFK